MNKLTLEYWPISALQPYHASLRKHEAALPKMVETLKLYGFQLPLLARRNGELVDGELRLKAAKELGYTELPVIPVDGFTEAEVQALRLILNRSATWASWDEGAVALELASLQALDFDLSATGFDMKEIDKLLHSLAVREEKDIEAVPDVPELPTNQVGDLWLLGEHSLYCGDATHAASYSQLLAEQKCQMLWTDPPYNVNYKGKAGSIKNDAMSPESFRLFLKQVFSHMVNALQAGGAVYVAHADGNDCGIAFREAFVEAGLKLASCLIWRKNNATLSRADYHWQHEPILYGWLPGAAHRWCGDRKQTTVVEAFPTVVSLQGDDGQDVWQVVDGERLLRISGQGVVVEEIPSTIQFAPKPQKSQLHPTMKPVALIAPMIMNSCERGEWVLDPFGGSGSTLMACEQTGRICKTMELDPKFADVIILRWQEYTGGTAIHAVSNKSFAEVQAMRSYGQSMPVLEVANG